MKELEQYIAGWRTHDISAVLATLADDCLVIESYGPVYRGIQRVEQWMQAWFNEGGSVDEWQITSMAEMGEYQLSEWTFTCTWKGKQATFDGATIAKVTEGKISYLREYATTAPLYDWQGVWRE